MAPKSNEELKAEVSRLKKELSALGKELESQKRYLDSDPWLTVSKITRDDVTETTKVMKIGGKGIIVRVVEDNVAVFVPNARYLENKKTDGSVKQVFR